MENETKKSKLTAKDILAKTGPGIIMAAAAVGTGTVTTSAILGARYEYGMIWMVILALFMRGIYMRSAYTAQVVLGMPILDCINKFLSQGVVRYRGFRLCVWLRCVRGWQLLRQRNFYQSALWA